MSDITSNQQADLTTRIQHVKQFLKENPDEQAMAAARMYNLNPLTLYSQLTRRPIHQRGYQNKILQDHHVRAIHDLSDLFLHIKFNPHLQAELAKQEEEEENRQRLREEKISIITDTGEDLDLQLDCMSFPEVNIKSDDNSG